MGESIVAYALDNAFQFTPRKTPILSEKERKSFGVFVSFERSPLHQKRANTDYVHGCIGDWDNEYKELTEEKLLSTIARVAYQACWEDSRRSYYKESIYTDGNGFCKVYFMHSEPFYVDIHTGKIPSRKTYFDNSIYGLIIENPSHRATYLPDVFPGKSWEYIKNSLLNKAGISSENNISKAYAYSCTIYKLRIFDYYVQSIHSSFERLYYFSDFVPYSISSKGEIEIKKGESVRNVASIYDFGLLQIYYKPYHPIIQQKMKINIQYYVELYKKNGYNQSSLFLLLYLYRYNIEKNIQSSILKEIKARFWEMEPDFEQGEALYVLSEMNQYQEDFYQIFDRYTHTSPFSFNYTIQDIFRLNWHVKSLTREHHLPILTLLQTIVLRIFEENKNNIPNLETNYLAVGLECISTIKKNLKGTSFKDFNDIYLLLFRELNKRQRSFFLFTDGSARFDITGHILQAYYNFLEN